MVESYCRGRGRQTAADPGGLRNSITRPIGRDFGHGNPSYSRERRFLNAERLRAALGEPNDDKGQRTDQRQ